MAIGVRRPDKKLKPSYVSEDMTHDRRHSLCCLGVVMTKDEFLSRVVGSRYSYDKVPASFRTIDKVTITCPEHGDFNQAAYGHMRRQGCPSCKGTRPYTTEEFVELVRPFCTGVSFSEVEYISGATPITLICMKHGRYSVNPKTLLQNKSGNGCMNCRNEAIAESRRSRARSKFLSRIGPVFESKGLVLTGLNPDNGHITDDVMATVRCSKHGTFTTRARNLYYGCGCKQCGYSDMPGGIGGYSHKALERNKELFLSPGYIYVATLEDASGSTFYKVGVTRNHPKTRMKNYRPYRMVNAYKRKVPLGYAFYIEQELLQSNRSERYIPEHSFDGQTECLSLCPIRYIEEILYELR